MSIRPSVQKQRYARRERRVDAHMGINGNGEHRATKSLRDGKRFAVARQVGAAISDIIMAQSDEFALAEKIVAEALAILRFVHYTLQDSNLRPWPGT